MNHLDLCSGIGGFALAARWHGMTTVGFCEIDPWCRRVLAKNFPGVPQHDDIKTLTGEHVRAWVAHAGPAVHDADDGYQHAKWEVRTRRDIPGSPGITLVTGGYPCQPFSLAGKRMGEEDDRHLWPYIAALVADLRPRWCLLENVAGHITLGLDGVLSDLEEIDYTAWPVVVPACAVNAPHRRDRVWILAHAQDGGIRRGGAPGETGQPPLGSEAAPDATYNGSQHGIFRSGVWSEPSDGSRTTDQFIDETESGMGQQTDGLPGWVDGRPAGPWGDDWERDVLRVSDGADDRVNKLKALGNAIVPQVAYEIMGALLEEELGL